MTSMPFTEEITYSKSTVLSPLPQKRKRRFLKKLLLTFLSFFLILPTGICTLFGISFLKNNPAGVPPTKFDPYSAERIVFSLGIITDNTFFSINSRLPKLQKAPPVKAERPTLIQPRTEDPPKNNSVCLKVKNILQNPELPNGCEAASLAIALSYYGFTVSPLELYTGYMPKAPYQGGDPWYYYVGDATDLGYGCYAPCVVNTGNSFLASHSSSLKVRDVSGNHLDTYENYIDNGIPVILWGTVDMNCNDRICWEDFINGKYVNWHSYSHCLVLIGYTDNTYIFCDPLVGITEYEKTAVKESFEIMYKQACIIE